MNQLFGMIFSKSSPLRSSCPIKASIDEPKRINLPLHDERFARFRNRFSRITEAKKHFGFFKKMALGTIDIFAAQSVRFVFPCRKTSASALSITNGTRDPVGEKLPSFRKKPH